MSHSAPEDRESQRSGGAVQELAEDPASRKKFLKMVGGGGAAAFSIFLAACGNDDNNKASTMPAQTESAEGGQGDAKIVNYALTLEHLEADFYKKVIASGLFKGAQLELIKVIGQHESDHVKALVATARKLGATPAASPKTRFELNDAKSVLATAATVENLGAAAYLGQAGAIRSKEVLAAALSIHTVEGRHAAALNLLTGKPVSPDGAFAKPASMEQVLPKVQPFIAS